MPFQHQHGDFQGPVGVWPPSYVVARSGGSVLSSQHTAMLTADSERYNRRLQSYRRRHSSNVLKHENWLNASNEVERRKTAELLRRWLESNASKRTSSKAKQSIIKVEVSSAGDNNTAIIQHCKTFPAPRNKRRATANESETNRSTSRSQSECFAESIQSTVCGLPLSSAHRTALGSSTEKNTADVPVTCSLLSTNFLPGTAASWSRSDIPKYKQQALADATQKPVVGSMGTSHDMIRGHDDRIIFDNAGGYDDLGDLATFDILTFMDGSENPVDSAVSSVKANAAVGCVWYSHPNSAISSNSAVVTQSYSAVSDCGNIVKNESKENVCRNTQHAAEKIGNSANILHHRQYGAISNQFVERKFPTHSSMDRNKHCKPVDMPPLDYISSCITGQSAPQPVYSQALEMQCYDMAQGTGNAEVRPLPQQQKQLVNIGQCMSESESMVAMPHQQMVFHQQRRNQSVSQQYWLQPRPPGQCGSSFCLLTDQQKSVCSHIDNRGYNTVKMMPDAARLNYKLMSHKLQETYLEKGHISNLVSASESSGMWSLSMESNQPVRNTPKSSVMCEPTHVAPAGTTYQSSALPFVAYYDYMPYEHNSAEWSAGDNRYSHVSPVTSTAFVPSNGQWPYCPRTMTSSGVCGSSVISQSQSSQNPHKPAVQNGDQSQSLHYPCPPSLHRVDRTRAMGVSAAGDLQQTYRPVRSVPMQDDDVFFSPTSGTKSSSLVRFGSDSDSAETGSFQMQHHSS